jgi:CDGSH-type Zn-finger protein
MITKETGMSGVTIKILDNGPVHVVGDFEVVDADGNAFPKRGLFSFCRCGLSTRKPYCDGAHREARFSNVCRVAAAPEQDGGQAD